VRGEGRLQSRIVAQRRVPILDAPTVSVVKVASVQDVAVLVRYNEVRRVAIACQMIGRRTLAEQIRSPLKLGVRLGDEDQNKEN
jgi:hypothetical protein